MFSDIIKSAGIGTLQLLIKKIPSRLYQERLGLYANLKDAVASGDRAKIITATNNFTQEEQARLLALTLNISVLTTDLSNVNPPDPTPIVRSQ